MDIADYNRRAWDGLVDRGDQWTVPVSPGVIAAARKGQWDIVLTPRKPVPRAWFPPLAGTRTLCLAGSGGQQAPVLAAAGARVTVLDASARQLGQDQAVAVREGLDLETVQGDMRDLRAFADGHFDLIVHPCSNCFVPEVQPVWREAYRVLRSGGSLLAGFINPAVFLFDEEKANRGVFEVRHRLPYADAQDLSEAELARLKEAGEPLMFSHSLEALIGGQTDAGFVVAGLYEDEWPGKAISRFMPALLATRALKP
jgi:SAM-dependent methyltransferase